MPTGERRHRVPSRGYDAADVIRPRRYGVRGRGRSRTAADAGAGAGARSRPAGAVAHSVGLARAQLTAALQRGDKRSRSKRKRTAVAAAARRAGGGRRAQWTAHVHGHGARHMPSDEFSNIYPTPRDRAGPRSARARSRMSILGRRTARGATAGAGTLHRSTEEQKREPSPPKDGSCISAFRTVHARARSARPLGVSVRVLTAPPDRQLMTKAHSKAQKPLRHQGAARAAAPEGAPASSLARCAAPVVLMAAQRQSPRRAGAVARAPRFPSPRSP